MITFFKSLFLFIVFAVSPIYACDLEQQKLEMASFLYRDKEFYDFACGINDCSFDDFLTHLRYRKETLVPDKPVFACFVESISSAKNIYTGVFVFKDEKILPQFVFFGAAIQTINKTHRGYKILMGSELIEAAVWKSHFYEWNGRAYAYRTRKNNRAGEHFSK